MPLSEDYLRLVTIWKFNIEKVYLNNAKQTCAKPGNSTADWRNSIAHITELCVTLERQNAWAKSTDLTGDITENQKSKDEHFTD